MQSDLVPVRALLPECNQRSEARVAEDAYGLRRRVGKSSKDAGNELARIPSGLIVSDRMNQTPGRTELGPKGRFVVRGKAGQVWYHDPRICLSTHSQGLGTTFSGEGRELTLRR